MKKMIKYRNNNNNSTISSLNYKFDSNSIAGKTSGTALDLIKKYNELAKEAYSNYDYVNAEIFRQYAEHYRKIVTDINERKNTRISEGNSDNRAVAENINTRDTSKQQLENNEETAKNVQKNENNESSEAKNIKSFKIIEISEAKNQETKTVPSRKIPKQEIVKSEIEHKNVVADEMSAPKRQYRRKSAAV